VDHCGNHQKQQTRMDSTKGTDNPTKTNGVSGQLKFLSFLVVAIVILFLTDSLEITNNNNEFKAGIVVKRKNMTELTTSLSQTASSLGTKWKDSAVSSSPPPPASSPLTSPPTASSSSSSLSSGVATDSTSSKPKSSDDESGNKQPTSTESSADTKKETVDLPSANQPTSTETGGTEPMVETPLSSSGASSGTTTSSTTETASSSSSSTNKETSSAQETTITTTAQRRYTYQRRGQPMTDTDKTSMIQKWGSWTLDNAAARSKKDSSSSTTTTTDDYYLHYPNRDVPRDKFPDTAWQKDTNYIQQFLQEGLALIERAMEAILAEYGHGPDDHPNDSFQVRSGMFLLLSIDDDKLPTLKANPKILLRNGGWTTPRSWLGLQRRLLHAIMTEDTFVFVMGGHSSAAGHGNLFAQSYTLQVARILEPIFARLGVKHEARNFGNGGLGTVHNAIGMASIYGPDIDFLMWDSAMTEPDQGSVDLFARQGLLGGHKVPFLYSLPYDVLRKLHEHAQVDVAGMGDAMTGIPEVEEFDLLEKEPYARRYLRCGTEIKKTHCQPNFFNSVCWIDRDDFTPAKEQLSHPGSQTGWHPGNRFHQLTGRVISFTLLKALHDALTTWSQVDGQVLPDEAWHVTEYYNAMRQKVKNLDPAVTACGAFVESAGMEPFLCQVPFQVGVCPLFEFGKSMLHYTTRLVARQLCVSTPVCPSHFFLLFHSCTCRSFATNKQTNRHSIAFVASLIGTN
jgi:hypothetical protein